MGGIGVTLEDCGLTLGGRRVLEPVRLRVAPGDKLLLLGSNGAGKTQLIKLLAGLRWPTAAARARRRFHDGSGCELELVEVRERIAYVGAESQDKYARYGWNHRLAEVVATGLFGTDIPLDVPGPAERRRVLMLLTRFGLAEFAGARMLELSYGQRRLALVARALAARPGLLLLDEVFNGLDPGHRRLLLGALRGTLGGRVTVVVSAHRAEDVPPGMTRAALVERGRVRPLGLSRALASLGAARGTPAVRRGGRMARRARPARIEFRNASVYRDERAVLAGLDWSLHDGEHWAVTGRNGSGKSTLLGTLYGWHPVALGGELLRRGHPRGTPLEEIQAGMGLVSPELQSSYDPAATLEELVVSGLRGSVGLDGPATRDELLKARRELEALGLGPLRHRLPREVSYGELRLALFARAFVRRPSLLLLDEPFTGLDPGRRRQLRAALSALARGGTQLVIAVHHRDDLPPEVNRRLHLRGGRATVLPVNPRR